MKYKHNIDYCFNNKIAGNALDIESYNSTLEKCNEISIDLQNQINNGELQLFNPDCYNNISDEMLSVVDNIKANFKNLLVLGTGGSTLCGQVLTGFSEYHSIHSDKTDVHFIENVDPDIFLSTLDNLELKDTYFLVVSKSGSTLETISQFVVALSYISNEYGKDRIKDHFCCISDDIASPLRRLADEYSIRVLEHERKIGGRFSLLTNVGLIPGLVAGIDANKLLKSAVSAIEKSLSKDSEAMKGAAINYEFMKKDINIAVTLSYVDRLKNFAVWQRQIWSESLGKEGKGSTPINSSGTLDQHSQLQLYLDGPDDKFFTVILLENYQKDFKFDEDFLHDEDLAYIRNHNFSEVIKVSSIATRDTLIANNKPTRSIEINRLDEEILGELIIQSIFETVYTASLLRLNAFDQPAVEEGKILAKKLLSSLS